MHLVSLHNLFADASMVSSGTPSSASTSLTSITLIASVTWVFPSVSGSLKYFYFNFHNSPIIVLCQLQYNQMHNQNVRYHLFTNQVYAVKPSCLLLKSISCNNSPLIYTWVSYHICSKRYWW